MFGIKSKKEVAANYQHHITVKTDSGDVEFANLKDVFIAKIFDIFYIFCEDESDVIKPVYGTRTKKAEKEAKRIKHTLLKAYNKGCPVVTLS